ncbi:MAG: restriction endonuclease [Planktomarina sp.]
MTNVWGIHIPEWIGPDALADDYVCIGWHKVGDLSDFPTEEVAFKSAAKSAISAAYPEKKEGAIPGDAGMLWRFRHEFKAGDIVVYPSKHNRQVNIGRLKGRYSFGTESLEDGSVDEYPNMQDVDWLGNFPRDEFSQSALYEIGSIITIFKVKRHAAEFLAKIEPTSILAEQEDQTEALDDDSFSSQITKDAEVTAQDFVIKRLHTMMDGYDFEEFIAHLMECMGYTVRVTPKSNDGGIDVIAHNDQLGFEPPIIKVQCKRTTNQINETQVRELLGTLVEGEFGLFVTLGAFDRKVRLSERNLSKLRLIDGEQLFDLIVKHYADLSPRYRTLIPLRQIYVPDLA